MGALCNAATLGKSSYKTPMNVPCYRITTPYGGWYETDARGYVVRCDNGLDKREASLHDLMSWQITGIREIKPFNHLGDIIRLDEACTLQLKRKNGKPRYTLEDVDHGTTRIHGNWNVHGVASIYKLTPKI